MAIAAGKLLNIKDKKGSAQTKPGLMMMPGQAAAAKGTEPAEDQAQSQGQSGIPVSYTHLRAHETEACSRMPSSA